MSDTFAEDVEVEAGVFRVPTGVVELSLPTEPVRINSTPYLIGADQEELARAVNRSREAIPYYGLFWSSLYEEPIKAVTVAYEAGLPTNSSPKLKGIEGSPSLIITVPPAVGDGSLETENLKRGYELSLHRQLKQGVLTYVAYNARLARQVNIAKTSTRLSALTVGAAAAVESNASWAWDNADTLIWRGSTGALIGAALVGMTAYVAVIAQSNTDRPLRKVADKVDRKLKRTGDSFGDRILQREVFKLYPAED